MSSNTAIAEQEEKPAPASRAQMVVKLAIYGLVIGAIWYAASGRLDWWMGWAVVVAEVALALTGAFVVPLDRELEEERTQIKEGVKKWDKPIVIIGNLFMPLGFLVIGGLDVRYSWSPPLALWLQVAALVVAALGRLLATWAAAENRFYGRFVRIQKERGHTVVSSGPYGAIRHPGYTGIGLYLLGAAVALGSLWALAANVLVTLLMIVRTALEDRTLRDELDGYEAYTRRVRYRLIPGVW